MDYDEIRVITKSNSGSSARLNCMQTRVKVRVRFRVRVKVRVRTHTNPCI